MIQERSQALLLFGGPTPHLPTDIPGPIKIAFQETFRQVNRELTGVDLEVKPGKLGLPSSTV
jgi:hypothetical protein